MRKITEAEYRCEHAAQDQMNVNLHVLRPDQHNVEQCAEGHYPPQDGHQTKEHIGKPRPAKLDEAIEFTKRFGVDDLFAFFIRLKGSKTSKRIVIRSLPPAGTMPCRCCGQPSSIV
jgi:hypothetical protein